MDPYKAQARARRREQERETRRNASSAASRHRRCFWTWPLGHEYVNHGTDADPQWACVSCDKPLTVAEPILRRG